MIRLSQAVRTQPLDSRLAHEAPGRAMPTGPDRQRTLRINLDISAQLMRRRRSKNTITPENVIDILNDAEVRFLLAGAHAMSAWANEPRNTLDVDVLVASRHVKVATRALTEAFPRLITYWRALLACV